MITKKKRKKRAIAILHCCGGCGAVEKINRKELTCNCQEAMELYPDGLLECQWGCMGLGSCVSACRVGAIHINEKGLPEIDKEKCIGCKLCERACPKSLISMEDPDTNIVIECKNQAKGGLTRKACATGCIACGICQKNCPVDAITMIDNHASIDPEICISCGMCAVKCPRQTIVDLNGIFTAV